MIIACFSLFGICAYLLFAQTALACEENSNQQVASISKPESASKKTDLSTTSSQKGAAVEKQLEATDKPAHVDVDILKKRLTSTSAIGFFTKLAIRNDLVDLMGSIKKYRKKSILNDKLDELRAHFDGLILKIVALLDEDPDLSRDLYVGREDIWQSLLEVKA